MTMSRRELDRVRVLSKVVARRLTQRDAARQLGLTERHVRRLLAVLEAEGPAGLRSRKRGRPSGRRRSDDVRKRAVGIVRERYADFGPTLAQEKLREHNQLSVSVETLRQWMIADGLWVPRAQLGIRSTA
ncbi:MAG: helix-turn-helix domain-containing protein [Deltaproteobacteria bacterium]|nr:helix-turn-helix domain-containing protein [Deltaproteobacteria bacterium]